MPSGNGLGPRVRDNADGTICVEYEPKKEGMHEVLMSYDGSGVDDFYLIKKKIERYDQSDTFRTCLSYRSALFIVHDMDTYKLDEEIADAKVVVRHSVLIAALHFRQAPVLPNKLVP
ncbi:hypothetical protein RRG08_022854 [Elysia crispata]|uniref:Uncharacterized protein n=1 Tax=Elysia crispata TaxID=231223 RepID=A0AAE0Z1V7_9GAST|nr:hypothetical protein RRG08_022854 [Elysia crispata]